MEETIITDETRPLGPQGLLLTQQAQYYLNEGAGWARFLGIVGFIMTVFILLIAIFAGSVFSYFARFSPNPNALPAGIGVIIGIIYGLIALLYFFPSLYIFQFGSNAKKGVLFSNSDDVTIAVIKLKSFLKFWGIFTIIALSFSILSIIGLVGGMASMQHLR